MSGLLPCPFCGEILIEHEDHHGSWWAHRQDPGPCIASTTQLFDEDGFRRWNQRPVCEWKEHPEDGYWQSACGEQWCFVDGGVKENRVRFCHGCGGKVEVV